MAPTRKSRSVNKRYANDASPIKDGSGSSRSKQKKKLSNKLGPQWSKGELQRFYEAYRIYGKDWKKLAAQIRDRSVEMVEALYNMNQAYLSLPEGTASVVGLIAMMTDHYNVLEGSDSERESNDTSSIQQKSHKHKWRKHQLSASKEDDLMFSSMAATDGCLSLLKRAFLDGSQPRVVKKRTPRIPVSYSCKKNARVNYTVLIKGRESEVDANDDEVTHMAALTLTEVSHKGGSPRVSLTPYKRTEHVLSSPAQSWEKTFPQPETAHAKLCDASPSEDRSQGRTGSRKPEYGFSARDRSSMPMEGVRTVEVHRKGRKICRKKMKVEEVRNSLSDDGAEACSITEEGMSARLKGTANAEDLNAKQEQFPLRVHRNKKQKLFFGDENSSLDALQTLAHLSLMFPDSTMESESSARLKEERTVTDMDDKSSTPEVTSTSHPNKLPGPKEKKALRTITEVEGVVRRKSKLGRYTDIDVEIVTDAKEQPEPLSNSMKKRRKPILTKKLSNAEALANSHLSRNIESETSPGGESKISFKGKCTNQVSAQSKQWKPGRVLEGSAINSDQKGARIDLVASSAQLPAASQGSKRSRRKMHLWMKFSSKELEPSESILKNQPNKCLISQQDKVVSQKEDFSCCLTSELARRWCIFEWFYSAIDYPWFANREFVEYLNHVGLGHIPRLTRVELGVIRSSLGKPRRFSERFLHDEREKLKHYRESVRKHYAELRNGIKEGLPRDLPRPLSVGQRVIAIHPKTRELHDGSILTVDDDKCRVQFDRPEIGVEYVMDIDCMPSNTFDNMPEALRRQIVAAHKLSAISKELQVNGHTNSVQPIIYASDGHMKKAPIAMDTLVKQTKGDTNCAILQAKSVSVDIASALQAYDQPSTVAQIQEREVDIQAVSELYHSLTKKEALLMELKNTNNDIVESHNGGDGSVKDSEYLRKDIAMVLVQLKEANGQASSALLHSRQWNTYPENFLPPWLKLPANSSFLGSLTNSCNNSYASQESGHAIIEIVRGSRLKAHTMVDTAIKAMSTMKEGEDAYIRIGEALDHIDKQHLTSDSRVPLIRSPEQVNGSLSNHNQFVSSTEESLLNSYASGPKLQDGFDKNETQIPSELITSCIATMLMIQTCTERQYTPADVAQIIDSAVSSLHPCCPANLPIYREIEMCIGWIKTQMLALIPI